MILTSSLLSDLDPGRLDDGVVWSGLNEANKARTAKDCSEQFYTDLRWSMSAWLLQQRFDTHDKTSLGAPNRRFAIPQADWHLSLGVGHNEQF